jgi:integrase
MMSALAAESEIAPPTFRKDRPAGAVRNYRANPSRAIRDWLPEVGSGNGRYLFPSRFRSRPHLSTRQYARIVDRWVESAGLDSSAYGTHSMRRTKAAQIYKKI